MIKKLFLSILILLLGLSFFYVVAPAEDDAFPEEKETSDERIERLIEALQSDDWYKREEAQRELCNEGSAVFAPLEKAFKEVSDFDTKFRIKKILSDPALYLSKEILEKIPGVSEKLKSSSLTERYETLLNIINLGQDKSIELMKVFVKDKEELIRILAAQVLASQGDKESEKILIKALEGDYAKEAARCIGCAYITDAIPNLIEKLPDKNIIQFVRYALTRMSKESLPLLIEALKTTEDMRLKFSIIETLDEFYTYEDAVKALALQIENNHDGIATLAVKSLAKLGGAEVIEVLRNISANSSRSALRVAAERALAELYIQGITPTLLQEAVFNLKMGDANQRLNSAWLIGQIGTEKEIPLLKTFFNDSNDSIKYHAVAAAVMLGDEDSIQVLQKMLEEKKLYFEENNGITSCQFEGFISISAEDCGKTHTIHDAAIALSLNGHRVGLYGLVYPLFYENIYWGSRNIREIYHLLGTDFGWKSTDPYEKREECAQKALAYLNENIDYLYWHKSIRRFKLAEAAKKDDTPINELNCTYLSEEKIEQWHNELEIWRKLLKPDSAPFKELSEEEKESDKKE
ncbi:MAG: HEAT repeat domain-containing protein [Planctomycetota bacterium]